MSQIPENNIQPDNNNLLEFCRQLSSFAIDNSSLIDPSMMTVIVTIQKLLDSILINSPSSLSSIGPNVLNQIVPSLAQIISDVQRHRAIQSSYAGLRRQIMYFYNVYRKMFAQSREESKLFSDERIRLESLVTHLSKSVHDRIVKKRQSKQQMKTSQTMSTSQSHIYDEDEKLSLAFFMEDQKRFAYSISKNESFIQEINDFMQDELAQDCIDRRSLDFRDVFGIQTALNRDMATANESIRKTQSFLSIFEGLD
jgi:hypothetical protein